MVTWRTVVALCSLSMSACSYHLYSPPTRAAPLESPRTLPVAQNAIAVEGGLQSGFFDPTIVSGALRYRRGLAQALDGVADFNVMHVLDAPSEVKASTFAGALRAGAKYQVNDALALFAGVGGGLSAAGGFVSPDIGVIVGYENPYLVPFLSLRGFLSQPIGPRRVFLGNDGDDRFDTPLTTWGLASALGVRIPIQADEGMPTHSLALGLVLTRPCDQDNCNGYFGLAANFEGVYAPE